MSQEKLRNRLLSPGPGTFDPILWKFLLSEMSSRYKENPIISQNAAVLIEAFQRGRDHIFKKYSRLEVPLLLPQIGLLVDDEDEFPNPYFYYQPSNTIAVTSSFLHLQAHNNPTSRVVKFGPNRSVAFLGTSIQLLELAGVEEGHHSIYYQLGVGEDSPYNPEAIHTEHDAQDIEYYALLWKLRYARSQNMAQETVEILQEKVSAARMLRISNSRY